MNRKYEPTPDNKWEYGQEIVGDWHKYKGPCPLCGSRTFNYGGGWRCLALYCNKNSSNPAPSVGEEPKWWFEPIQVKKDGSSWMAYFDDFINLQESLAAFGDTPEEAVDNLKGIQP